MELLLSIKFNLTAFAELRTWTFILNMMGKFKHIVVFNYDTIYILILLLILEFELARVSLLDDYYALIIATLRRHLKPIEWIYKLSRSALLTLA